MKKKIKVKVAIAPKGCKDYIKPGKEYKFLREHSTNNKLFFIERKHQPLLCAYNGCAHLNGQNWKIKNK